MYSCLIIYDADSAITARLKLQTNNFSGHKICIFKLIILQNTLEFTIWELIIIVMMMIWNMPIGMNEYIYFVNTSSIIVD